MIRYISSGIPSEVRKLVRSHGEEPLSMEGKYDKSDKNWERGLTK